MAKDNLFLGQARGSIGDVTFYRMGGQQVSRARNRHPRNPQSILQLVQRIVAMTASRAYSLMIQIVDHSFQYKSVGTGNQSEFMRQNVAALRDKLADIIANPTQEAVDISTAHNFSYPSESLPPINEYIVSAGSLPSVDLRVPAVGEAWRIWVRFASGVTQPTYQDICDGLGLQAGDQLTFITATHDFSQAFGELYNGFEYARIILSPASGDMSAAFFNGAAINDPNPRNEGSVDLSLITEGGSKYLSFESINGCGLPRSQSPRAMAGVAVIVSRQGTTDWLRSAEHLSLCPEAAELNAHTIGEAVSELKHAEPSSALYLNQANVANANGRSLMLVSVAGISFPICATASGVVPVDKDNSTIQLVVWKADDEEYVFYEPDSAHLVALSEMGYRIAVVSTADPTTQAAATEVGNYFNPPITITIG